MRESFIAFYIGTHARKTRLLLYSCFAAIASVYIAVNRLALSRPEHAVSLEVAALLALLVVASPVIYHFVSVYQEERLAAKRVALLLKSSDLSFANVRLACMLTIEKFDESDTAERNLLIRESYNLLMNQLEAKQIAFDLALGFIVAVFASLFAFVGAKDLGPTVIYVTVVSGVLSVVLSIYFTIRIHSEHRLLKTIMNEILKNIVVTPAPKQPGLEQKQESG